MFTVFACIIIFIAWAWAYKYVYDASDSELKKNRKWVEQLPSLIAHARLNTSEPYIDGSPLILTGEQLMEYTK